MSFIKGGWFHIGQAWAFVAIGVPIVLIIYSVIAALIGLVLAIAGAGWASAALVLSAYVGLLYALYAALNASAGAIGLFLLDTFVNFWTNLFKVGPLGALAGVVADATSAWNNFKAGVAAAPATAVTVGKWILGKLGW